VKWRVTELTIPLLMTRAARPEIAKVVTDDLKPIVPLMGRRRQVKVESSAPEVARSEVRKATVAREIVEVVKFTVRKTLTEQGTRMA